MFTSLPTKRHRVAAWSFAGRGAGRFARRVDGDAEESGMSTDGNGAGWDDGRRNWGCTLWLFNIAMGNSPFIDGLPIIILGM